MRDISYTTRRKLVDRTATVPRNPPASWTDGITPKLSSRWRHWVRGSKTPRSRRRTRPKKTKEKRSRRRGNTGKVRDHETWKWEGFRKCERQRKAVRIHLSPHQKDSRWFTRKLRRCKTRQAWWRENSRSWIMNWTPWRWMSERSKQQTSPWAAK